MSEPTKAEAAFAYERLTKALKDYGPLPTEKGKPRVVKANEFMYMQMHLDGAFQFKHSGTRNYVFVQPTGKLEIPTGGSFMLGFFDSFQEDVELTQFRRLSTLQSERTQAVYEAKAFPWHVPAEVDGLVTKVYLDLHTVKAAMDSMEEIPKSLQPLYDQTGKALAAQDKLRVETQQLREMAKRSFAQYR